MTKQTFSCAAMALLLLGATCGTMASAEKERKTATAGIKDGKGQNVGQAKFTATKGGVQMSVAVTNLSPGVHAIHIHEAGKCDAPGFTTAGATSILRTSNMACRTQKVITLVICLI